MASGSWLAGLGFLGILASVARADERTPVSAGRAGGEPELVNAARAGGEPELVNAPRAAGGEPELANVPKPSGEPTPARGAPAPTGGPVAFQVQELRLAHPVRQEVFVVPTSPPGARSLVVAGVGEGGDAAMSVFTPGADGRLPSTATKTRALPDEVLALDSDGAALFLLAPDAVWRWEPESDTFTTVAQTRSMYQVRPPTELIPARFVRDADGDGDSDLVVPDFAGHRVFLQGADGKFAEGSLLRVPPIAHHQEYNKRITYRVAPIYFHDVDGDGTRDAVATRGDQFFVFRGQGEGRFADPVVSPLGLGITEGFLGDDVGDVDVDHTDRTWKRVVQVRDFDGDGVLDLFAHRVHSTGLFDKEHSVELHRGTRHGDSVEFASRPSSRIESAVIIDDPTFQDIDGDGRLDFSTWSVGFGVGTLLGWLVTGTIDLDISLFRLDAEGRYPPRPSRKENVEVAFDLKSGKPTVPPAFLADVDGDRRRDLIVGSGGDELRVFAGNGSDELFEESPAVTRVRLPGNGRDLVSALDVNGDGRDDVLIRYGRVDGDLARTMKLLISR